MSPHNDPTITRAWTMYDWANSAYSLIITSAIFPAYFTAILPENIQLLGHTFTRASVASYSISLSFIIVAILSPILSGIADSYGNKKSFMKFFCYLGAIACMLLFWFRKGADGEVNISYGLLCSILASIGYCGSIVFYNAYLPEIVSKDQQDDVSAKGFAMGYIGSVILMVFCFAFIMADEQLAWGLGDLPARISFLAVGIWWIAFAQITFYHLPAPAVDRDTTKQEGIWLQGYKALQKVWLDITHRPTLQYYLIAFFFFNMGVQTVMYMATYFAADELHMSTPQLLGVVLVIQLVAILGARLSAFLSSKIGNLPSLIVLIIIWMCICVAAYYVYSVTGFYALAFAVGMVMGGIQSMSRSSYAKMLPANTDTASYFSFYDVCEKVGIVIGTLTFGLVADMLGGMRHSALGLLMYFFIGLLFLIYTLQIGHKKQLTS